MARKKKKQPVRKKKPAQKTVKTVKKRKRKSFQALLSLALTFLLLFSIPTAAAYYFLVLRNREDTAETRNSQEEETVRYGDLPRIDVDLQMDNIREAAAGEVVDAKGLDEDQLKSLFSSSALEDEQLRKMEAVTWSSTQKVIASDDLVLLRMLHKNFDNQDQLGEMIVARAIARDVLNAFFELYQENYQIEKMVLLDAYKGDLELSRTDNNTSAFSLKLSLDDEIKKNTHSLGLAIDLNPFYNPIISGDSVYEVRPYSAQIYADRDLKDAVLEKNHMIYAKDKALEILSRYGFAWQGTDSTMPQYQLFEYKGSGSNTESNFTLSASYDLALKEAEKASGEDTSDQMDLDQAEELYEDDIEWSGQEDAFEYEPEPSDEEDYGYDEETWQEDWQQGYQDEQDWYDESWQEDWYEDPYGYEEYYEEYSQEEYGW